MEENLETRGILTIKNRNSVTLDGVKNIEGFDESYVSLDTESGRVIIEGKNMKIESLTADSGIIFVRGLINAVYYSEQKSGKGIFSRFLG